MNWIKKIAVLVLIALMAVSLVACGDEETSANLSLVGGIEENGIHTLYVPSSTDSIDLKNYLTISEDAKWKLYTSTEMKDDIDSVVSLQSGDNFFYVRVKENGVKKDYSIRIVKRKAVTITFDSSGGSACEPIVVDEGSILTPPTTIKAGYDFAGWGYDFSNPVTSDMSCTAQWSAKKFYIKADGTNIETVFGTQYSIPAPQARAGYKFIGWQDASGKDFPASGTWNKTENVEVVAVFAKETYKLSYNYNASIAGKSVNFTVEDELILETPVHPDGLEFEGWYTDAKLTNRITKIDKGSVGDKTVYANWKVVVIPEPEIYKVTIDADGFEELDGTVIDVQYGEMYYLPDAPEKAGYAFVAWMNGEDVIATAGIWTIKSDVTLAIKWEPKTFGITYIIDGKTTNPNTIVEFTPETDTIVLQNPQRPNATFLGWYTDPSFSEESKITEIAKGTKDNITLYASFQITVYTLTYDPNNGTVSKDSETYEMGDEYTLLIPEHHGYEFLGWYDGETLVENGVWSYDRDVTLVASWKKVQYLVTYDLSGGNTSETLKVAYTVDDSFTLPVPTREGYYFLGWCEEGTGKNYQSMTVQKGSTGNKKFVAMWSEFSYSFSGSNAIVTNYRFINTRPRVKIPKVVNYNGIDYTVTEIGASVFEGMGTIIKNKQLYGYNSNGQLVVQTKFEVDIPITLQKIGTNAFNDCNDVCIRVALGDSGLDLWEWADTIAISEGNKHVLDVIKGRRPAIGWSIYG